MPVNNLTANNLAASNLRFFGAGPYLANNLANTQPRQDSGPVFTRITIASNLAAGGAGIGNPSFSQNKNTFTALSLTSAAAGIAVANVNASLPFLSIANYSTFSPLIDGGPPSITLKALYNFTINTLTTGSAGFGLPTLVQMQTISASNLVASGAGIDQPQFVQFNALSAVNLAAGAAGIGTPTIGNTYAQLSSQLVFASVDSNINQINAALTGLAPLSTLVSIGNLSALIASAAPGTSALKVSAAIAIPNKATLTTASVMSSNIQKMIQNIGVLFSTSILKANIATFIFDTESFAPGSALGAQASQAKANGTILSVSAAIAVNESARQAVSAALLGSTALFANLTTPAITNWSGLAILSPISSLTAKVTRSIGVSISFNALSSLISDSFLAISGSAMSPEVTLTALTTSRILGRAALSNEFILAIFEAMERAAKAPLSVSATLSGFISSGKPLTVALSPLITLSSVSYVREIMTSAFALASHIVTAEVQKRAAAVGFSPTTILHANSQTRILPIAHWSPSATLSINERVLPEGTAFYFAHVNASITAAQIMTVHSSLPSHAALLPSEGLYIMAAPAALKPSALMISHEDFIIGPNLTLVSNILLSVPRIKSLAAVAVDFVGDTNLEITYSINECAAINLQNNSTMTMTPRSSVSGLVKMFTGCYFNINITQQKTVEQGQVIIAQKSNNRIVAQGDLVILSS